LTELLNHDRRCAVVVVGMSLYFFGLALEDLASSSLLAFLKG
jgi:hypothetical protein